MDAVDLVMAAAVPSGRTPNLWGALGCAVAYSAALFAVLDGFADLILARGDSAAGRLTPGIGLKFGSKIAAAVITVVAAALVLALDQNWFAFATLSISFVVIVGIGVIVLVRHTATTSTRTASGGG
ncbi:hypothetical protein ASD65_18120 [Microbacterium sp. Root61]|uniref:hypothetical protein n=1 Tax=Microbacterium sp. Root61 TaxID=1736570 RepID=UPI0006FAE287|nr:hypothetical protein [Microbacterium sp. Root61]KRA22390.1 hypothetical protein ASD65_18120 [Microbacterium sp. Root61]